MRLLKTANYALFEAHDIPVPFPHYAILSHTWTSPKEEITYQDIRKRKSDIENNIYKQKGWSKLTKFCDRAAKDGWDWAWMDNCCIDKTNPADIQEAINAMFRYYQDAGLCYAYLEDVDALAALEDAGLHEDEDPDEIANLNDIACPDSLAYEALHSDFIKARWFSRGWTLQELLAPHYLVFVDREWRRIGSRETWASEIKEASSIEARHLTSFRPTDFQSCSIAMRLSWASRRVTTVQEDETYSLLGLFGVSLPLIYGEGRWRAFNRLQRELITVYNDDSIFAWTVEQPTVSGQSNNSGWGILASSSEQFRGASEIESLGHFSSSFSMTNRGLEMRAKLIRHKGDPSLCLLRLNCGVQPGGYVGIYLRHVYDAYDRVHVQELCDMDNLDPNDWEGERGNSPILIRVSSSADTLTRSSIFALEYPAHIRIGTKYFVDFSPSMIDSRMQVFDQDSQSTLLPDLTEDELFTEPNRTIFINIELLTEGFKWELDVIINLTENGFPSVGVLGRASEPWERLGDPLGLASQRYDALANYLHFRVPSEPTYPTLAVNEINNCAVGVSLLPRPLHGRLLNQPPEMAKFLSLREYVLRIKIRRHIPLSCA
ncbi:Vegetative incompatibility protein HET-E-1 [Metarhizium brunneum]|uniref:Vegetative incompatibility protein HET-E-1 n=1 Tax=Metarhizium brunneum TaxID=500148 RepID=A0A7D5UTA8_9HYPO